MTTDDIRQLRDELAALKATVEVAEDHSPGRALRVLRRRKLELQLRAAGVDPATIPPAPRRQQP
ncbi:MAG: hypothetical protein ACRDZ3_19970 [Acidimicrobiia bacterium]